MRKIWTFKRISYLAITEPAETIEKGTGEHLTLLATAQPATIEWQQSPQG